MPYPSTGYNPYYTGARYGGYGYGQPQPAYPVYPPYGREPAVTYNPVQSVPPAPPVQPVQPLQQPQPQVQPQPQQNVQVASSFPNRIWVNGIEGAKGFQMSPNTKVILMDSERPKFYIKVANADGVPNIERFTYQKDGEGSNLPDNGTETVSGYSFTKEDLNALEGRLTAKCEDILDAINTAVKSGKDKK